MGARRHSKPPPVTVADVGADDWAYLGAMVEKNQRAFGRFPGRDIFKKLKFIRFVGLLASINKPLYEATANGRKAWEVRKAQLSTLKVG